MILIDYLGHMVSDEGEEELHRFARRVGLKRVWFQDQSDHPHYDLTTTPMRLKAMKLGASMVSPRHLIECAWWSREKREG